MREELQRISRRVAKYIRFFPAGNVSSTNVQSAIEELDTEKQASLGTSTTTTVLHGDLSWSAVTEDSLSFSNVATANATTTRHGLLPILSNNATQFLNGQGNYTSPPGTANSFMTQAFTAQTSVNVIHNFGTYPVVQVILDTGAQLMPKTNTHNTVNDFTVTFNALTTGTIIASVGSPQPNTVVTVTSPYTALTTDRVIHCDVGCTSVTLYTTSGNAGRELYIDNDTQGDIVVYPFSGQTIENEAQQYIPTGNCMAIVNVGSEWRII